MEARIAHLETIVHLLVERIHEEERLSKKHLDVCEELEREQEVELEALEEERDAIEQRHDLDLEELEDQHERDRERLDEITTKSLLSATSVRDLVDALLAKKLNKAELAEQHDAQISLLEEEQERDNDAFDEKFAAVELRHQQDQEALEQEVLHEQKMFNDKYTEALRQGTFVPKMAKALYPVAKKGGARR